MLRGPLLVVALSVAALGISAPSFAGELDDFATGLKEATGDASAVAVLTKLMMFKLGKKCWAKLPDKNQGAVHAAGFATRDVIAYAKDVTGDDWNGLEPAQLDPKVDAFKSKFMLETTVDGDDCDAKQNSLWIGYWSALTTIVKNFPPPSGKALIKLDVSSKTKDLTVDISKDGTTFSIKAPKDIAAKDGGDKLERPFRKLASGITDDFAFATKEATGKFHDAWVLTKLHTFKLGKKCVAKLSDKDGGAVHAASFVTRDIAEYAKAAGAEDWDAIESQSANDPKTNRDLVGKDMDGFKSRLSLTINVEGDDCDAGQNALWLRYWTTIATALKDYPPKAKKVAIVLNVTSKAKDVTASGFTFTAPRDKEAAAWDTKLVAPFKKASGKK
jgi:hypothetical protein